MDDCVFCKIIKGEIVADFLHNGKRVVAFADANPSADTHILVVPKQHIETILDINSTDKHKDILAEMIEVAQNMIKDKGIEAQYKLIINGGKNQIVPHIHLHILGGKMKGKI